MVHSLLASAARASFCVQRWRHSWADRQWLHTAANTITSIKPDGQEKRLGRLNQRHVQAALEALHRDGIVAVEDVVDVNAIDTLNARMVRDTRTLVDRGNEGPFNYNLGNLQQSPLYEAASFHSSIFFNSFATQLTGGFLGGRPTLSFISSNAAVRAEQGQPVHCDADFDHPQVRALALVLPLLDHSLLIVSGRSRLLPSST